MKYSNLEQSLRHPAGTGVGGQFAPKYLPDNDQVRLEASPGKCKGCETDFTAEGGEEFCSICTQEVHRHQTELYCVDCGAPVDMYSSSREICEICARFDEDD